MYVNYIRKVEKLLKTIATTTPPQKKKPYKINDIIIYLSVL